MKSLRSRVYSLLRRSETFFKTDMVYLAKGGFWLSFVQVSGAVSAFALSVAFARLFPKDTYGTYKYIIALSGIIGTFTLTGLGPAITQSVARGYNGALSEGFRSILKWGTIIVAISFSMAAYYFVHKNFLLAFSLVLIGITSPLIDAASLFGSFLNGKKDFRLLSILNTIGNTFPTLCLIAALFLTKNLPVIISVYFLSYTIILFTLYLYTKSKYHPEGSKDPGMVPYAKHLTFITILNTIADQADKIMVYHYIGAVELAVYTFATALPLQIKGLLKNVSPLSFPKFATRPIDEIKEHLPHKMFRFAMVIIPIVITYIFLAPYIYHLFFPKYNDAILASQIFALSLPATISLFPSTVLQAKRRLRAIYHSSTVFSIIKLATLFLGIKLFGFWGVIAARVIYEYIGVGLTYWYVEHSTA